MNMAITSFYFLCFYVVLLLLYYLVPGRWQYLVLLGGGMIYYLLSGQGILLFVKYSNFLISIADGIGNGGKFAVLDLLVPLGISYYTFTMLGYVIDLYYGIGKNADHIGRFLLFGTYFPTLISGPIMSYQEMEGQWRTPHKLDYRQVTFGMQRVL